MKTNEKPIIYMDYAATSWPKPPEILAAMGEVMKLAGGNPGRGGHQLTLAAGASLLEARETVANFFGCDDPFRVAFSANVTESLNLVINGFLKAGDHVLVSPLEHNAVMRPLHFLEEKGIDWDVLPSWHDGRVNVMQMEQALKPNTRLIIVCHESNVNGVIQPLSAIGAFARAHNIYLLADVAQSAGHVPIHLENDDIDFLAFTGHKGLFGPSGTGGMIFGKRVDVQEVLPLKRGGTGSLSESFAQPSFLPDRFESGTPNTVGLAGLAAGIRWVKSQWINDHEISDMEPQLMRVFIGLLQQIKGIQLYVADDKTWQGNVLSLTIEGVDNALASQWLDREHGIMTRAGLHCAPLAHRYLNTFPAGAIRFSIAPFTTIKEIETCVDAVNEFATDPGLVLRTWEDYG